MIEYKSKEEEYFSYYLDELKDAGFVVDWNYESSTFELCSPYKRPYLQQLKTKVTLKEEHLLHKSSITADFTITWSINALNIFYLDHHIPTSKKIKDIPFRLSEFIPKFGRLISLIEIKPTNESTTTSSISFPLKQKQLQKDYGLYIQKIKPFDTAKKGCLFERTFVPKKAMEKEIYKVNTKFGKIGESKFKYKLVSLDEFLNK